MKDHMAHADLLALLETIDVSSFQDVRYVPTSFDSKDQKGTGFPFTDRPWQSAQRAFREFESKIVMARLPFFWQLHAPLHAACRKTSAVMYANAQNNAPLALAAIRTISVDTIVTDAKNAESFAHEMYDDGLRDAMSWLVIQSPADDWRLPDILRKNHRIAQEIHLFPGIVLLEQCKNELQQKSGLFHLHENFVWEIGESAIYISGGTPVPLTRYKLPFALQERGACDCGKTLYASSS